MAPAIPSARFVGPEGEFLQLAELIDAAAAGTPRTLLLIGSSGLGASRFLDEAAARIARLPDPPMVLRASAAATRRGSPYEAIAAALRPALLSLADAELAAVVGPGGDVVARLLPELAPRLGDLRLDPGPARLLDPERRSVRTFEAILGVCSRLGERRPLLLVVEDAHRADRATLAALAFLARVSRPRRVGLVTSVDPGAVTAEHPVHETLRAMAEGPIPPTRVELAPLDRAELAQLIEAIEGERPSASVLLLVAERSGGNPLIAEELLLARRELSAASLTGSFEQLVVARLARRSAACRRLLRLVAAAGHPVSRSELAAIDTVLAERLPTERGGRAGRPAAAGAVPHPAPDPRAAPIWAEGLSQELRAALDEAFETGELVERVEAAPGGREGAGEALLDLRHERIRRAVMAELLPDVRARHRAAVAAAGIGGPARIAAHWWAAHRLGEARVTSLAAAAEAEAVAAPADALRHLELALELEGFGAGADGAPAPAPAAAPAAAVTTRSRGRGAGLAAAAGPTSDGRPMGTDPVAVRFGAADAALAAGRSLDAVAYAEAGIGCLGGRSDRRAVAVLYDRLGRYRRAAGDYEGAEAAMRRALELVPGGPSAERARILADLAQHKMLDGTFSEARRLAGLAIQVARAVGPAARLEEIHALATLGVSEGWGDRPDGGLALLAEARRLAAEAGDVDALFRTYANETTILDLLGERERAIEVALVGIEAMSALGMEATYGNFLRGNAADTLFTLGRWAEARRLSETAVEWSPAGVSFLIAAINLAIVEVEASAGEAAGRLLGRLLLELETVADSQYAVPVYQAAASYALWREDPVDAGRAAARGWERVRDTEDWVLAARMAATALEVEAQLGATARQRRDLAGLAGARERAGRILAEAERMIERSGVPGSLGSRREADLWLAMARAFHRRLDGRDDPEVWDGLAQSWQRIGRRYEAARARWRQAEAILAPGGDARPLRTDVRPLRGAARRPLHEAAEIAAELGARPLLRALRALGERALIRLPDRAAAEARAVAGGGGAVPVAPPTTAGEAAGEAATAAGAARRAASMGRRLVPVGPGPRGAAGGADRAGGSGDGLGSGPYPEDSTASRLVGTERAPADPFGLSPREREVLALIAAGMTNREIGEALFISDKTVGVHVGNILAKLGVAGRVEAATVAVRLGLTERS